MNFHLVYCSLSRFPVQILLIRAHPLHRGPQTPILCRTPGHPPHLPPPPRVPHPLEGRRVGQPPLRAAEELVVVVLELELVVEWQRWVCTCTCNTHMYIKTLWVSHTFTILDIRVQQTVLALSSSHLQCTVLCITLIAEYSCHGLSEASPAAMIDCYDLCMYMYLHTIIPTPSQMMQQMQSNPELMRQMMGSLGGGAGVGGNPLAQNPLAQNPELMAQMMQVRDIKTTCLLEPDQQFLECIVTGSTGAWEVFVEW